MEFNHQEVKNFKSIIESIVDAKIKSKRITTYVAAIVQDVDVNGYISVIIPPELNKKITGLLNKTGEVLNINDSVELATKNGLLSNSWVAVKHGTNNSGGSGGGSGTSDYNALRNKPMINTLNNSSLEPAEEMISGTLNFHRISKSGDYTHLLNKPFIPDKISDLTNDSDFITIDDIPNSDWNATSGLSVILNKPEIPSIEGLESTSNKVSISALSTSEQYPNAKSVYDFVQEALADIPQGLKIPISIATESDLPATGEDGDYYYIQNMNATAPGKTGKAWWNNGQWYKIIDQYQTMDGVSIVQTSSGAWQVSTEWLNTVLPDFATVATTGDYNDLINKPTIPTATSDLTNDSEFITLDDVPSQLQADWLQTDDTQKDFIKNKPIIPEEIDNVVTSSDSSIKDWITVTNSELENLATQGLIEPNRVYNVIDDISVTTTIPVGAIITFAGNTSLLSSNYMPCNGAVLNKSEYSELFDVIGYIYGGSGSTFNLPDYRNRTPIGLGETVFNTLGEHVGEASHTLTIEEIPSHTHPIRGIRDVIGTDSGGNSLKANNGQGNNSGYTDYNTVDIQYTGGSQSHNNMQPSIVQNFIIKVKSDISTDGIRNLDNELAVLKAAVIKNNTIPIGIFSLWRGNQLFTGSDDWQQLINHYGARAELLNLYPEREGYTRKYKLQLDYTDNKSSGNVFIRISNNDETSVREFLFPNTLGNIDTGWRTSTLDIDNNFFNTLTGWWMITTTPDFATKGQMRLYGLSIIIYDEWEGN